MRAGPTILIHADGTIQVRRKGGGNIMKVGNKRFRCADQAHNEVEVGPYVYTEIPNLQNSMELANVIPFPHKPLRQAQEIVERTAYAN